MKYISKRQSSDLCVVQGYVISMNPHIICEDCLFVACECSIIYICLKAPFREVSIRASLY